MKIYNIGMGIYSGRGREDFPKMAQQGRKRSQVPKKGYKGRPRFITTALYIGVFVFVLFNHQLLSFSY